MELNPHNIVIFDPFLRAFGRAMQFKKKNINPSKTNFNGDLYETIQQHSNGSFKAALFEKE